MYCERCGKLLEEGMDFCPECGNKVSNPEAVNQNKVSDVDIVSAYEDEKTIIYEMSSEKESEGKTEQREAADSDEITGTSETLTEHEEVPNNVVENVVAPGAIIGTSKIKYCHNCGVANAETDAFCYACGKPMNDNSETRRKTGKAVKKSGKKIILGTVIAIAVLLVVIAIGAIADKSKNNMLIYLKDNEFSYYAKKDTVGFSDDVYEYNDEIYGPSNNITSYVTLTKDGKYIFYPQNYSYGEFDLYCKKMSDVKSSDDKIASGISNYTVLQNNKVVYMENSGSKKMYISDLENKEKIASDVLWYRVSEDEKYILWKTDSDDRIYICDLALKSDKIKVDSDISSIVYVSDDLKNIVYRKDDALYYFGNFEKKEKIDLEVVDQYVVESNPQTEIYYLVDKEENIKLIDLVEDDYASQDANMQEPDISDYQKTVTKPSFWGMREEVVTDDAYYIEMDKYNEKVTRDYIREYMNEQIVAYTYTMYCYKPGEVEAEEYTTGVILNCSAYKTPVLIYSELDLEKGEKVKFSQIMNMDDYIEIEDSIRNAIADEAITTYMVNNGKRVALNIDRDEYSADIYMCVVDKKHKECYFEIPENQGNHKVNLFRTNYDKMDGEMELVSDEYCDIELVSDQGVYYTVESDDGYVGELYLDGNKIDSDVMSGSVLSVGNGEGIVYLTDPDDMHREGTLRVNTGTDSIKISDDVAYYVSNDKGDIAFLEDYNYSKYRGDLKVFKNNKVTLIDSDVTTIWYY